MQGLQPKSRIWITGASSGIGEALAWQLAAAGHSAVITGRNQAALDVLAQQSPLLIPAVADVTHPEALKLA